MDMDKLFLMITLNLHTTFLEPPPTTVKYQSGGINTWLTIRIQPTKQKYIVFQ